MRRRKSSCLSLGAVIVECFDGDGQREILYSLPNRRNIVPMLIMPVQVIKEDCEIDEV